MTVHHHPVQFEQAPDGEIVVNVPHIRIKLIRNTKGYGWEISCAGESLADTLIDTKTADDWMREHYGSE